MYVIVLARAAISMCPCLIVSGFLKRSARQSWMLAANSVMSLKLFALSKKKLNHKPVIDEISNQNLKSGTT